MAQRNTSDLWDEFWQAEGSAEVDILKLAVEENSIRWRRIEQSVLAAFPSLEGLKVIEIGAGAGTNAALMAKRGAEVTVLDYSDRALERARALFRRSALRANFLKEDALCLPQDLLSKFDVSMSFGLAEHFAGWDRVRIIDAHLAVLRVGGVTFISVPNKYCLPYRIFKTAAEFAGKWRVGEEYPYSRRELKSICSLLGISDFRIFGDDFLSSFAFINPVYIAQRVFKLKSPPKRPHRQKGTLLDAYLSYALVLCARRRDGYRST